MSRMLLNVVFAISAIALAGCSTQPTSTSAAKPDAGEAAKKEPAGPPQPIPAKTAFWEAYKPAYQWASDILCVGVKDGSVAGVKNADGKAGVWIIEFASQSKGQYRTYTYAVADQAPDILKGIRGSQPMPWAGATRDVMPFQSGDFSLDSDAAFQAASKKADSWLKDKDNAAKPYTMNLGSNSRWPNPVWAVQWGNAKAGYLALVNATTGEIITK